MSIGEERPGGAKTGEPDTAPRWHLPLLLAVSVGFESLFFRHGMNRIDEGWPLYAAKLLHEGGTLYRDVFFVFPPGHLLAAWLGAALDPPGLLFARGVYLAFDVAACLGIYLLGRRVMPAPYALLGALLLAIGAPGSHLKQLLFGYRYLAIAMLALLAFARRLDGGSRRFTIAAGALVGVALTFRLTPAFATAAAIGLGIVVWDRRPGAWLREGAAFAGGLCLVVLPLVAVLWIQAGPEALWREVIVRPVAMTAQQSLPIPSLELPEDWTRREIRNWFVAVQFRGYALLYLAYAAVLGSRLIGSMRRREPFGDVLLLSLVAWGGLYFARTLGRSDEPHLDSALPPACLLMAHATSLLRGIRWPAGAGARRSLRAAVCSAIFASFAFLTGSDYIAHPDQRGHRPFASTGGEVLATNPFVGAAVDWCVEQIRAWSRPGEIVLDLSASPLLLVLADRHGPGHADLVMPGTFANEAEERAFVARLEARPPALVIWPTLPFDRLPRRSVARSAPLLTDWVRARYEERGRRGRYALWAPRTRSD